MITKKQNKIHRISYSESRWRARCLGSSCHCKKTPDLDWEDLGLLGTPALTVFLCVQGTFLSHSRLLFLGLSLVELLSVATEKSM